MSESLPNTPTHLIDANADATVNLTEKNAQAIKSGRKTVMTLYNPGQNLTEGNIVNFATSDGDVFATVEVNRLWTETIQTFVNMRHSGHVRYESVDACINALQDRYPDADLTPETMLTVFGWTEIAVNDSAFIVESVQSPNKESLEFAGSRDEVLQMKGRGSHSGPTGSVCGVCGQRGVVDKVTRKRKYMTVERVQCAYCGTTGRVRYRHHTNPEDGSLIPAVFSAENRCIKTEQDRVEVTSETVPRCNVQRIINTARTRFVPVGESRSPVHYDEVTDAVHEATPLET